jgi:hypothetical protein
MSGGVGSDAKAELAVEYYELIQCPKLPGDIMLVTKRWMADTEALEVLVLLPEKMAEAMSHRMQVQPTGTAPRREIPIRMQQTIAAYADKCAQQGCISRDAAFYLRSWSTGQWPRKPKPLRFSFLNHNWAGDVPVVAAAAAVLHDWVPPNRNRRIKLVCATGNDLDSDTGSDDDDVAPLPIGI